MYQKRDRLDDPKYREWVHEKPCLVSNAKCSHPETVVPHHIFGGRGNKDDKQVVPLCFNHHEYTASTESVHWLLKDKFEKLHNIDMLGEAVKLYREYRKEIKSEQ